MNSELYFQNERQRKTKKQFENLVKLIVLFLTLPLTPVDLWKLDPDFERSSQNEIQGNNDHKWGWGR